MIILYRIHTKKAKKKHTPPKAAAIRLTLLLFPFSEFFDNNRGVAILTQECTFQFSFICIL